MPSTETLNPIEIRRGGGRIASDHYRKSLALSENFSGLEEGVDRYALLLLVKRVGRAAGFTSRMIQLLDYLMAFTRPEDWEQGSRPIVFQSLARTALDLGMSERHVQRLEQALFERGAITFNDSGNHRRYGQRDPASGRILYAFGVDLTPLAYLQGELQQKLQEKKLYDDAVMETKRQISWYRRQLCALLAEWSREDASTSALRQYEERYKEVAIKLRTDLGLETLRALLTRHQSLHSALMAEMGVGAPTISKGSSQPTNEEEHGEMSSRDDAHDVHYKYTTHQSLDQSKSSPTDQGFQKSVAEPPAPADATSTTGIEHVALSHVLQAASERFRAELPLVARPLNWGDVVEAAYRLRIRLGISQASWGEACAALGRNGAAVALLITDRAALRDADPVLKPAAYFRGMVVRARGGELRLHASVFGLLERRPEVVHA